MSGSSQPAIEPAALLRRQLARLVALIVLAAVGFFVTRAVAADNRARTVRDAVAWYRRGEAAMSNGAVDDAIDAFRHAVVRDRSRRDYAFALARALLVRHDDAAAEQTLLPLREAEPDDPQVNLQLARVSADRHDVPEALRYYHNALYAAWPVDQAARRRDVRVELIRFLVAQHDNGRALPEMLALSRDLPSAASAHVQLGTLFADAGDPRNALDQFEAALQLDPRQPDALAGAGLAAYQLADYSRARQYLNDAPQESAAIQEARGVVALIIARDPLAARIGAAERQRRLASDLADTDAMLNACVDQLGDKVSQTDLALQDELRRFRGETNSTPAREPDVIEDILDLQARIARTVMEQCSPPTPMAKALVAIAKVHGAAGQ